MLELRVGARRYKLASVGTDHVTLANAAEVAAGNGLLATYMRHRKIRVTEQEGLVVRFVVERIGRPAIKVNAAEVAAMLAGGLTLNEMATECGVSLHTIYRRMKQWGLKMKRGRPSTTAPN